MFLALTPASSHAAELTLFPHSQLARPGQLVTLHGTTPAGGSCRLRIDAQRLRVTTTGSQSFVISARVSKRAQPGGHSLSLRCSSQQTLTRVAVARRASNRHAHGELFHRVRISALAGAPAASAPAADELAISTAPFRRSILPASAAAQLWWAGNAGAIVTSFRNGQCTDWAQLRRPDIVQSVYMQHYDRFEQNGVVSSWDAQYWAMLAAQVGLPVGHAPVVGAIMVFAPGSYGAGSAGHVAVVEAVAADGSFQTTAMHSPSVGQVTRQSYGAGAAAAMATDPGIAFIL